MRAEKGAMGAFSDMSNEWSVVYMEMQCDVVSAVCLCVSHLSIGFGLRLHSRSSKF